MPNDSLREEIEPIRRAALAYIASNRPEARQRRLHIRDLQSCETRLQGEIEERSASYLVALDAEERAAIDARRAEVNQDPRYQRASEAHKATHREFENLRRVNGGGYPKNISPVLYVMPLILVGVAEWYVNFSTFSSMFIPVFAIAATIVVAAVFAWASHLHGAYLKQISEITHPSVEYRNVLGRKIIVMIATLLLIAAFATVVWLRWLVISEQLGINTGIESETFGGGNSWLVWSKVGPTIVINILIWGLGTLYSWALHEKIPGLRESYRAYLHASRVVDRRLRPFRAEEKRLRSHYEREREKNKIATNEYNALLEEVRSTLGRVQEIEPA
jgi:hypothetical protein